MTTLYDTEHCLPLTERIDGYAVWRDAGGSTYTAPLAAEATPGEIANYLDAIGAGIGEGYDLRLFATRDEARAYADRIRGTVTLDCGCADTCPLA